MQVGLIVCLVAYQLYSLLGGGGGGGGGAGGFYL
jgi:hypothetical protein